MLFLVPLKHPQLFSNNFIIQPFSAVAVGAGVFCRLVRVDPAQIISTRAAEVIGAGAAKAEDQFFRDAFDQTDADRQRMVDAANVLFGEMPDEVAQAALIDGAQLFQQDDGGQFQAVLGVDVVVGGKFGFHAGFARNGSDNDRGAVFVPDIVLNDHDGAIALLLGADTPGLDRRNTYRRANMCGSFCDDLLCVFRRFRLCRGQAAEQN